MKKKLFCKILGHRLIVVNNIFNADSPDRLCLRCKAVNFTPTPGGSTWFDKKMVKNG